MSKVKISSSITVPYSFRDKSGKEVIGSTDYAMCSDGYGIPKVVKCTAPLSSNVEVNKEELVFDFKGRLITDAY